MTARSLEAVRDAARWLLPLNRGAWVLERARTSVAERSVRLGAKETAPLDPEQLWADTGDRGRGRHAHGFTFFADWVGAYPHAEPDEAASIRALVLDTVAAWDARFGSSRATDPKIAYHDETTAQRLLGVTAALDALDLEPQERASLEDFAARTASILMEPAFHSGLNNHGMFQDAALLAWSVLAAEPDHRSGEHAWSIAEERLLAYFRACFTSEGVHVENTPTYHVMVARYLPVLAGVFGHAGSASAAFYEQLQAGAERFAVHCVAPDGRYPPVSDTQRRAIDTELNLRTFASGEFEFAATRGQRGRMPVERTATFPASGYAMTRSAWGDPDATFVHFVSAYNADYHKHSDELSVFLRSSGRDLLCEAGAYGYNWQDPLTKYAYSSAAHNTMLVNGAGLPRTEARGAASTPLNEMRVDESGDALLDATGATRRYPGREWSRRLVVTHGAKPQESTLRVEDAVRSSEGAANLRFLWHLGPGLRVLLRPCGAEVFDGTAKVMEVEFRTDADIEVGVVEAVGPPNPQGWYHPAFGEKVAAPVLTLDCWQADVTVETDFRLSGFRWGAEGSGEGRASLRPLLDAGAALPAWHVPGDAGARAVVMLAPHAAPSDRDRLTAELQKSGIAHWFVPEAHVGISAAPSPDLGVVAHEQVADAVAGLIRQQRRRHAQLTIAAVGHAFAPALEAALRTGAPLLCLDPTLPLSGAHWQRLARHLTTTVARGERPAMRVLVTDQGSAAAEPALQLLDEARLEVSRLGGLLPADAEDGFSDVIRNALAIAAGTEPSYLATYDRRERAFVLELHDQDDAVVAARLFHGKDEVASMPYTAGATHRLPFEGRGPHRLRIHVRDADGKERFAFTTGAIRAR